mmetsp:Transcript_7182/g.21359  ORF Transcript_7182/g.21359 Transcript_7182/m.21359 type:complete len:198 (-) Transcript_7182:403-996(-)
MSLSTRRQRRLSPDMQFKGDVLQGMLLCFLLSVSFAFTQSPEGRTAAVPFVRPTYGWRNISPGSAIATTTSLYMVAKSGAKEIVSPEAFEEIVLSPDTPRPCLVFFSAPWCGPCRLSNPVVRDVMKQFAGRIDVVETCTDDLPEVASDAGVVSIPTIQIYYGGELLDTIVGCVAKNVLASAVDKILEDLGQGEAAEG